MTITTRCPICGTQYRVPQEHAGRKAKCRCGHVLIVPRGEDALSGAIQTTPAIENNAGQEPSATQHNKINDVTLQTEVAASSSTQPIQTPSSEAASLVALPDVGSALDATLATEAGVRVEASPLNADHATTECEPEDGVISNEASHDKPAFTGDVYPNIEVLLEPQPDGGYIASVPALGEWVTDYGHTREEALAHIQEAIQPWIEEQSEAGKPLPIDWFSRYISIRTLNTGIVPATPVKSESASPAEPNGLQQLTWNYLLDGVRTLQLPHSMQVPMDFVKWPSIERDDARKMIDSQLLFDSSERLVLCESFYLAGAGRCLLGILVAFIAFLACAAGFAAIGIGGGIPLVLSVSFSITVYVSVSRVQKSAAHGVELPTIPKYSLVITKPEEQLLWLFPLVFTRNGFRCDHVIELTTTGKEYSVYDKGKQFQIRLAPKTQPLILKIHHPGKIYKGAPTEVLSCFRSFRTTGKHNSRPMTALRDNEELSGRLDSSPLFMSASSAVTNQGAKVTIRREAVSEDLHVSTSMSPEDIDGVLFPEHALMDECIANVERKLFELASSRFTTMQWARSHYLTETAPRQQADIRKWLSSAREAIAALAGAALSSNDHVIPAWEAATKIQFLESCFGDVMLRHAAYLLSRPRTHWGDPSHNDYLLLPLSLSGSAIAGGNTPRVLLLTSHDVKACVCGATPSREAMHYFAIGVLLFLACDTRAHEFLTQALRRCPDFVAALHYHLMSASCLKRTCEVKEDSDRLLALAGTDPRCVLAALMALNDADTDTVFDLAQRVVHLANDDPVFLCHAAYVQASEAPKTHLDAWVGWFERAEQSDASYFVPGLYRILITGAVSRKPPGPEEFESVAARTWLTPSPLVWPSCVRWTATKSRKWA